MVFDLVFFLEIFMISMRTVLDMLISKDLVKL